MLFLVLGVVISNLAFNRITQYEEQNHITQINNKAVELTLRLSTYFSKQDSTLRYLKSFFLASDFINQDEFNLYSTSILLFDLDISRLLFVPEIAEANFTAYNEAFGKKAQQPSEVVANSKNIHYPIHYNNALGAPLSISPHELETAAAQLNFLSSKDSSVELIFNDYIKSGEVFIANPFFVPKESSLNSTYTKILDRFFAERAILLSSFNLKSYLNEILQLEKFNDLYGE